MFLIIVGAGKVGANLARELLTLDHELVVIEQSRARHARIDEELGPHVHLGDGTELYVLERAGIKRPPDIVVAATGDDEDNIVICQLAKERYGVAKVVARVNDPRNQQHFDLLGISPTISPTRAMLALIEHEVPEHRMVSLLELKRENLEIVEVELDEKAGCIGRMMDSLGLPEGARLIGVMRDGKADLGMSSTQLKAGDQVLAILEPGREDELRQRLLEPNVRSFMR